MEKKNYLTLDKEFLDYCKLNNIPDVEKLAKEIFDRGFTILKYGEKPILIPKEKEIVTPVIIGTPIKNNIYSE